MNSYMIMRAVSNMRVIIMPPQAFETKITILHTLPILMSMGQVDAV